MNDKIVKIGALSISDRASSGEYEDKGLPAIEQWLVNAVSSEYELIKKIIPDDKATIEQALIELADVQKCQLIFTTGGTGPSPRDVTPEATMAIADKHLPGFGEQMRQISLKFVPTAILSRQTAVIRGQALIVNLPGQPKSITETLSGLKDKEGKIIVDGLFAAIPYGVELISDAIITTNDNIIKAFRPKSAPPLN